MARLLVDECLHTSLTELAHRAGHEAYHVVWLGKAGAADAELRDLILEREFTFVTNNARDFRRLLGAAELHPGLIIILPNVTPTTQRALFGIVLQRLPELGSLINKVVEVDRDGAVAVYDLPALS